jgi:nitrogen fixation/metabolism regulation signal transduction histidine kinase
VLTLEDVTDELRIERVLAWGEMAQQVAHEVKNPLTPIKLGVQHIRRAWIDRQPDFEEILERNIGAILDEIDRLASVASSFSRFAAPSPAGTEPLEPVAVAEVAQEVLELYGVGGGPMRFELVHAREVPLARGRVAEVKEALVNLLENARAALPGGGRVKVEIQSVEGEIEVRVVDDGVGIPPEVLPRIFEPHFSTRSSGTGLGLAIVRRLVEGWGGRVQAESRPGDGTVIRIRMIPWTGQPGDHEGRSGVTGA